MSGRSKGFGVVLFHQLAGIDTDRAVFHHEAAQEPHVSFDAGSDVTHQENCGCFD